MKGRIGHPDKALPWANQGEEECEFNDGDPANHSCSLIKNHKGKKHACSCGHEFYKGGFF